MKNKKHRFFGVFCVFSKKKYFGQNSGFLVKTAVFCGKNCDFGING